MYEVYLERLIYAGKKDFFSFLRASEKSISRSLLPVTRFRCGSRIWSGGGPRSGTMKFAHVAKRSHVSEASPIAAGGPGPAQGPRKLRGF